MSTANVPITFTSPVSADELLAISAQLRSAGKRCELVRGKVISMSPASNEHGQIANEVAYHLNVAVRAKQLGKVFIGKTGFLVERDPDTVRAPDVSFVRADRANEIGSTRSYFPEAPTLAIEVVSPSDSAELVHEKAKMWIESGCESVWLLWPDDRTVTVYRSLENIRVLTSDKLLDGEEVVPGFSIQVADLFPQEG